MAKGEPDIDKVELKKLLIKSKKEPISCAVGIVNGFPAIMVHKSKPGRALMGMLKEEYKDVKDTRFGEAFVDVDDNPKLVILTLNKGISGFARKMKKTLKGTGFTKVRVMLEGGGVDEEDMEDEEEQDAASATGTPHPTTDDAEPAPASTDEPAPVTATDAAPASSEPAPATADTAAPASTDTSTTTTDPAQADGIDFKALAAQLTGLVRQMVPLIAAHPERANELKALASKAQAAVKASQDEAVEEVYLLDKAINGGADAAPASATDTTTTATATPPPATEAEPAPAGETAPASPQATTDPAAAPVDYGALSRRLTGLVRQMMPVIAADASRGNDLKGMASAAGNAVKAMQPDATQLVDAFEAAIGGTGGPAAAPSTDPAPATTAQTGSPAPATPPDPAKAKALEESPKLWNDTISTVASGIDKLKDAIRKDFASEGPDVVADIEKNLDRISKITERFDATLAELLKAAHEAVDDAARKAQLTKAKSVLAEHIKYAASEPLIGMLDDNPFGVSLDIKKTLVNNLKQLADVVR